VFIYAQTQAGQNLFVPGGAKDGTPIRIRHRNWLNDHTSHYLWGDAYLDWGGGEIGQATPSPDTGGGSPADWSTSLANGRGQPFMSIASTHYVCDLNPQVRNCLYVFMNGQPPSLIGRKD
jgi:hypothetical protein